MKYKYYLVILSVLALFGLASRAYAAELVQFSAAKGQEVITLTVPSMATHKVFVMSDPDRLVVDVPGVPGKNTVALPKSYKGKLIKAARFGWFDKTTSRFVFDLNRPVELVDQKVQGKKLVITIAPGEGKAKIAPEKTAPQETVKNLAQPEKKGVKTAQPGKTDKSKPSRPAKPKMPLIVIDAGHGGVDPGTIGDAGTQEKDIVLNYAKALKAALDKTGKYRTQLTRANDRFIPLRGRVAIARKAGANLFISLHADSAPDEEARGLSVYTVSEKASDKEAEALAARENKSDVIAGMNLNEERAEVADILISLAQRETKNNSSSFADLLVNALEGEVKLLPNAHRFAGFAVLKAPDVPSVLIEIGFLSNAKEEKLLRTRGHRDKVIAGIVQGVNNYFEITTLANAEAQ